VGRVGVQIGTRGIIYVPRQARVHPRVHHLLLNKLELGRSALSTGLMSFRRPKSSYRRRNVQSSATATSALSVDNSTSFQRSGILVPVTDVPRPKRPRNSKSLFLPGPEELITLPGRISFTQPIVAAMSNHSWKGSNTNSGRSTPSDASDGASSDASAPDVDLTAGAADDLDAATRRRNHQRKKMRLSVKWTSRVIPSLLPIYLRLLRETESLRLPPNPVPVSCACVSVRSLTVMCVFFQRKFLKSSLLFLPEYVSSVGVETIVIDCCTCMPAACQLLQRGLFPCAPSVPSLAVDLTLLTFTRDLFVRLPPNVTSFTEAVESFLKTQGYNLEQVFTVASCNTLHSTQRCSQGNLRRRFGAAYKWYSALCDAMQAHVQAILDGVRNASDVISTTDGRSRSDLSSISKPALLPGTEHPLRPTEYLRQRCPLCFGGRFSRDATDM
jgi:hypothetical protein